MWWKSSPAPAHVGSPAPGNLLGLATDSATSPIQVSRLHAGDIELTSQTLREAPQDLLAKGSRSESNPCFLKTVDPGQDEKFS